MEPSFSIIIPVKPSSEVKIAIDSIKNSLYPPERYEVIISEGYKPSLQRNQAAKIACGDILLFLDNDTEIVPDLLQMLAENFADKDVAVVGGPNLTHPNDSFIQKAFGCALASKFAHWNMASRYRPIGKKRTAGEKELILCAMAVKRDIFEKLGGFDERLYPNEENELLNRIKSAGYKIIYDPLAISYRSRRKNLIEFVKQIANYGRGRMEQFFVEKFAMNNLFFLGPLIFTLYLIWLFLIRKIIFSIPVLIYFLGAFISSFGFAIKEKRFSLFIILPFIYLIMHISYSYGLLKGLLKKLGKEKKKENFPVKVKKVKELNGIWQI